MAHGKIVSEFKFDTEFPRDHLICTLNFNHTGPTSDWDGLCNDLLTIWDDVWFTEAATIPMRARAYDNEGTPPVFPMGEALRNWTATPAVSTSFRERALCLSYYSERNTARRRGRVYLPCNMMAGGSVRPALSQMNRALSLGGSFAGLGGLDVDWEVWSPTTGSGMSVSNAWVDDEWDIQRRRGLRATTRVTSAPGP